MIPLICAALTCFEFVFFKDTLVVLNLPVCFLLLFFVCFVVIIFVDVVVFILIIG